MSGLRAVPRLLATALDYALFPGFLVAALTAAWLLQTYTQIPNLAITPLVVAPCVGIVWALEHVRPERPHLPRDMSLALEAAHFVFNFELGYGISLLASGALQRWLQEVYPIAWPAGEWPLPLQILLVMTLYEASSYWQHRLFHRRKRLWAFHALHHAGARLDLIRGGRFHCVDFATVGFLAYLPLVVLGTPENLITLMAVCVSVLGILHHGNVRQRSPRWLDLLICTPAVHRRHHSKVWEESDANFGNTVMIFDQLFGTYALPDPVGPEEIGIDEDPLPHSFWAQFWGPFTGVVALAEGGPPAAGEAAASPAPSGLALSEAPARSEHAPRACSRPDR